MKLDKKTNSYWKVHKNNIKDMKIMGLPDHYVSAWQDGSTCIDNYMYISYEALKTHPQYNWGFMFYNQYSIDWFKKHNYTYQGEFSTRKLKLKKLNE